MHLINGQVSSSLSYTYVLQPIRKGEFIIEPASIEVDGKSYSSNPVKISVRESTAPKSTNPSSNQNSTQNKNNQSSYEIFINESVSRRTIYQGDQLVVEYDVYTRETAESYDFEQVPDFRGFYTNEVEIDPVSGGSRAEVNGKIYSVYPIKKTILFPQVNGDVEIDPLSMSFRIRVRAGKPVQTFFGPRYRTVEKNIKLSSNPIKINVKPLPDGAPESFNGAVGRFQFSGNIDKKETKINEAINLNLKLSGKGNIKLIDVNLPDFPVDFEVYDPDIKTNTTVAGGYVSGTKTWSMLMIPRTNGTFEIPAIRFSYFDPQQEKYFEETVGPFAISVTGEGGTTAASGGVSASQREIQQIGNDIRYIKTGNADLKEPNEYFFNTSWFYLLLVLPFIFLAGALFAFKKFEERSKDVVGSRKRSANKIANKQLAQAKKALNENNKNEFFDAVYKALFGYLGNKLAINSGELNRQRIQETLRKNKVDESTIESLNDTLSQCEMARFAPVDVKLDKVYQQSENIILTLEDQIK
jgi:hypothetical protein